MRRSSISEASSAIKSTSVFSSNDSWPNSRASFYRTRRKEYSCTTRLAKKTIQNQTQVQTVVDRGNVWVASSGKYKTWQPHLVWTGIWFEVCSWHESLRRMKKSLWKRVDHSRIGKGKRQEEHSGLIHSNLFNMINELINYKTYENLL